MNSDKQPISHGNIEFTKQEMVNWYDPRQLFHTAIRVLLSSVFSTYADKRESFANTGEEMAYTLGNKEDVWLDYIADLGDGWNPTYTTAYLLAQEKLVIDQTILPRGDALVMGGDQVYPTSSREEYHNRMWGPYECAFLRDRCTGAHPQLYAIPGNHDWYDGLNNFLKFFCQQRRMGGWQTKQHRSYFALKLTPTCWLWGIDIQLNSDIDKPQLNYFKSIAIKQMKEGDHVILCTAEPAWVNSDKKASKERYEKLAYFRRSNIDKIEYTELVEGQETAKTRNLHLVLILSGDLHHYARYIHLVEGQPETYHITAGGGGTFLHATHNLPDAITWHNKHSRKNEQFVLAKSFPDKTTSKALVWLNLLFPLKNLYFSFFLGFVYMFLGWVLQSSSILYGNNFIISQSLFKNLATTTDLSRMVVLFLNVLWFNPAALLVIALLVGGFTRFADTHSAYNKVPVILLGFFHGLLHVLLAFVVIWLYSNLNDFLHTAILLPNLLNLLPFLGGVVLMYGIGGIMGGFLTGFYLIVANLLLKVHDNEAFSAFHHQDYKNFLRIRVSSDTITIYPIGVKHVPKQWKEGTTITSPSLFEPANTGKDPLYELIEEPITIKLIKQGKSTITPVVKT
ncbi:metallophosphoesterase [Rhodocytophaga aerolata]|uniref:Metallophosphoesterase n=1 Tax=Rhodocytophaga aerolata TaxID=455078 RepID=A0ABT8R430_9BACT|nr:metallophosphoesterase [Rhodocytophaga aerolata]MDO1446855.1 metallophosphoesterase [Rhodocytophaga aerolata]